MPTIICNKCGAENPPSARFCGACGHELAPKKEGGKSRWREVIQRIVAFLSGIGTMKSGSRKRSLLVTVMLRCQIYLVLVVLVVGGLKLHQRHGEGVDVTMPDLSGLPKPEPLPESKASSPIKAPEIAIPSSDVIAAVKQALAQMDAKYGYMGTISSTNDRAVYFALNAKWHEKAVPALLTVLTQKADALDYWKAAKLIESYLKETSAQRLKGQMVDALSYCLTLDCGGSAGNLIIKVISESQVERESKFKTCTLIFGPCRMGASRVRSFPRSVAWRHPSNETAWQRN